MICPKCEKEGTSVRYRAKENFLRKGKLVPVEYDKVFCTECNTAWIEGDDPFKKAKEAHEKQD